jgi:heme exporter protein A
MAVWPATVNDLEGGAGGLGPAPGTQEIGDTAQMVQTGPMPAPAALRLDRVSKSYGRHRALTDVSLTFLPAQVAAVLGPNGAGKSTMLGILSTLVPPTSGAVSWGEDRLSRSSSLRSRIGYVGHEPGVYGDLSAGENLRLFATLHGYRDADARARELLARVGLAEVRPDAPARTFSRGMQQRLSLARALLAEPQLLLFDEPSSALDPAGAAWLATVITAERDAGRIVIFVTHDLDAAAAVTEHVIILRRGRVAFDQRRTQRFAPPEMRALYAEHTGG